ncbi:MAG: C39 family peptidase [Lachnospiraceae bacterium]|nr:C39 family peptidase [Lachnospiraceae bacterium]
MPPEKVQLKVPYYCQIYDMPTGCELVSARMALEYYGVKVSYDDILKHLNRSDLSVDKKGRLYGLSPNQAFIGSPKTNSGFGCYPQVIADMITSMELDGVRVDDTSSLRLDFVAETYLTLGFPVLVWATIGMGDAPETDSWYLVDQNGKITKEKYTWLANEHCLVMVGYDKNYYYFNDPLAGYATVKYSRELVEKRYKEIGSYSLVIRND